LTDIDQLDVLEKKQWENYFSRGSIEAILAEHVWEHLTLEQGIRAAKLCFEFIRPGGRLRIAVPDGLHPDPDYIDSVRPKGRGQGAADHRVLYTWRDLKSVLDAAGFEVKPLEYFDSDGQFHHADWDPVDGMIRRSSRFDERNRDGTLRYTSIIFDAFKPVIPSGREPSGNLCP
jgi:predicted SAM-dependent methyltransferase